MRTAPVRQGIFHHASSTPSRPRRPAARGFACGLRQRHRQRLLLASVARRDGRFRRGHADRRRGPQHRPGHVYAGPDRPADPHRGRRPDPGWHGVHIHAVAQCEAPFTSAGGHINHGEPKDPHGLLNAQGPDDGDLPNIHADEQGRVRAEVFTTRARIARDGPGQWLWDADGSALVIHANADDHSSQPIGGAGARVACGIMAAG